MERIWEEKKRLFNQVTLPEFTRRKFQKFLSGFQPIASPVPIKVTACRANLFQINKEMLEVNGKGKLVPVQAMKV